MDSTSKLPAAASINYTREVLSREETYRTPIGDIRTDKQMDSAVA